MITFSCRCGQSYTVTDDKAGKRSSCKRCSVPIVVPELSLDDDAHSDTRAPEGGHNSNRVFVATLGAAGLLVLLVTGVTFSGSFWTSPSPSPSFVTPSAPPAQPAPNDDLRAIRQSVERQEAVAKDERREKARKEAIDKQLKELDELGRWNAAQHRRIQNQDKMMRP